MKDLNKNTNFNNLTSSFTTTRGGGILRFDFENTTSVAKIATIYIMYADELF